ncbi:PGF-CTERM sorting domain-containing protein [Halomicrobium mukohataei]|uniref:PGF-CTERM sorting domain-containing protein n=1 Tax=Halomicrobium mukohataei TaxID=57705 RepID=A0A847UFD4_9EURY|nr:BGTF surface domain-containing protein [Halomicrobium mukohataei]NLV10240.1 PGF-CTERM sorting domain-containing protein [Halomicrobium mukohataei]
MTGTNDKVRSLFLSALMVMSVVAMGTAFTAGAVADAGNNDTFSTASFENTPSEAQLDVSDDASDTQTQNVVIDGVYLSGEDDTEEVTIDFSDAIDTDLELNNEPSTDDSVHSTTGSLNAEYTEVNDESVVIELSSSSGSVDDAQFTTQFEWDVTDADADNGLAHEISATGSNNGEVSASVQYKTVGDFTESIAYNSGDKEVFRGETVQLQADSSDTTVRVYETDEDDDSLVTPRRAVVNTGANSDVINYDTSNLDAGQSYIVVFGDNEDQYDEGATDPTSANNVVSMTVTELDLSAELDSTDVAADQTIDVSASASTFNDEVTATLLDSNGDVVENDGEDVADSVNFDGSGEASLSVPSADDADYSTGSYTVEVEHTDTGITTETDTVNVTEAEDGDVSFPGDRVFTDEAGDIANVTVEMSNTDEATVTIGNKDQGYYIVYHVTDDSGDGQVSLKFNSYTAGRIASESDVVSVANSDDDIEFIDQGGDFTNTDQPVGSDTLDPTEYEMNASVGHVEMTSNDYTDADAFGTLSLQPRSTENLQTWVAPKGADLDEYSDDVGNLYDDIGSSITESGAAAYDDEDNGDGDTVILQLEAGGLQGAIDQAGDLKELVKTNDDEDAAIDLTIEQTNEEANRSPKELDFEGDDAISVINDGENNSYFIVVETSNIDQPDRDLAEGDNFEATFTIEQDNVLNSLDEDESEEVSSEFELVEPSTELVTNTEDDLILIESASGQTVSGQTNYAPGTDLTVRVKSSDSASPFGVRPEATVQQDGTFTTEGADFSDVSPGTNLTLQTNRGGSPIGDEYDGRIGEVPTASVSISNQTTDGSTVTVDSVTTENGGFVAIHLNNASGEVIGNSEYLDSGTQQDVEISLDSALDENATVVAMPHQDTNDNEEYDFGDGDGADGPYTENGSAVTDSATVTIQTTEDTDTPTPEPETDTPTPDEDTPTPDEGDDTATDDGGDETTTGDGAGFGAVVALVGLLAAALLATRRNN